MVKYTPINFIKDFNLLKPSKEDIDFLKEYIETFTEKINNKYYYKNENITPQFKSALEKVVPGIHEYSREINIINGIIQGYKRREKLILKKITNLFNKKSGVRKGRTSIFYIIKKKLRYKFLKATTKT